MYPEIITVGPVTLYSFGAMMGLGFLAATNLAARELSRRGLNPDIASNLLVATALGGIGGARIWAIANEWEAFIDAPLLTVFAGAGFVWYGGLIGGATAAMLVFRRHGTPWLRGADCIAPGLLLGQAIGRIGCHLAGDGDWGAVTTVPWGVAYTEAIVGWPHAPGVLVHPTPLYEAAAYSLAFVLMWSLRRRLWEDGSVFAFYLLTGPAARFAIEFYRINPKVVFGLTQAQIFSLALVLAGAALMVAARSRITAAPPIQTAPAGHP
jgi:phosphatidylglycerol:prolipoprotein diacylglycerol transferase